MDTEKIYIPWDTDIVGEILYGEPKPADYLSKYTKTDWQITPTINFMDNFWDFSDYDENHNDPSLYRYHFEKIKSAAFRYLAKRYVLRKATAADDDVRHSTLTDYFNRIIRFIGFLESEYIQSPSAITTRLLRYFWDRRRTQMQERAMVRESTALKGFLTEVDYFEHNWTDNEFDEVLNDYDRQKVKNEEKSEVTPDIPRLLFNRIISCAIKDINNEEIPVHVKEAACIILLLSQIGMRIGEALKLEIKKLRKEPIFDGAEMASVMEFWTYKTTRSKEGKWTETRMTPHAIKAYEKLYELGLPIRERTRSKWLYPNPEGARYTKTTFRTKLFLFFFYHQEELDFISLTCYELKNQVHKGTITKQKAKSYSSVLTKDDVDKEFYYVNTHQFRVHVCNELKEQDVPLQWIQKHMNHLQEEMTKHYFRGAQEKLMEETLSQRASSSGLLETNPDNIASEAIKKELMDPLFKESYECINRFLKKNKLNIRENLAQIIAILKSPVREMELGYCLNALSLLCDRQERLTTQEKWYSARFIIPNLVNLPFTYKRFQDKMIIVEHNRNLVDLNPRFKRFYELEHKSLQKLCSNRLYPELGLLKKELEANGDKLTIMNYPSLEELINNFTKIEMECLEWMKKPSIA